MASSQVDQYTDVFGYMVFSDAAPEITFDYNSAEFATYFTTFTGQVVSGASSQEASSQISGTTVQKITVTVSGTTISEAN